jgi:hypothetical protein
MEEIQVATGDSTEGAGNETAALKEFEALIDAWDDKI